MLGSFNSLLDCRIRQDRYRCQGWLSPRVNCRQFFVPRTQLQARMDVKATDAQTLSETLNAQDDEEKNVLEPCMFQQCASMAGSDLGKAYADVGWKQEEWQLPIVYHERYNITALGLEKLHPFDSCKFRKVVKSLADAGILRGSSPNQQLVSPLEASHEVLLDVHSQEYVSAIHGSSFKIAQVTELAPLVSLPVFLLRRYVVSPMKYHVAGTIAAAGLALQHGWAINLGGGMHHAYRGNGMGWCPFDDIMLAIRRVRSATSGTAQRVLYIDLDAHQGNGVERDKLHFEDKDLYILDMYNARIFPKDDKAKPAIDYPVELDSHCTGEEYISKLQCALLEVKERFPNPDLIVYNAGTDILVGDPLGRMDVGEEAVLSRDEIVWQHALEQKCPIVMTLSGGYTRASAAVVAKSIENLFHKYRLDQTVAPPPEQPKARWFK